MGYEGTHYEDKAYNVAMVTRNSNQPCSSRGGREVSINPQSSYIRAATLSRSVATTLRSELGCVVGLTVRRAA